VFFETAAQSSNEQTIETIFPESLDREHVYSQFTYKISAFVKLTRLDTSWQLVITLPLAVSMGFRIMLANAGEWSSDGLPDVWTPPIVGFADLNRCKPPRYVQQIERESNST
jgi:hypothetical protein